MVNWSDQTTDFGPLPEPLRRKLMRKGSQPAPDSSPGCLGLNGLTINFRRNKPLNLQRFVLVNITSVQLILTTDDRGVPAAAVRYRHRSIAAIGDTLAGTPGSEQEHSECSAGLVSTLHPSVAVPNHPLLLSRS